MRCVRELVELAGDEVLGLLADVDGVVADPLDAPRDDDHPHPPLLHSRGRGHREHLVDDGPVRPVDELVEVDEPACPVDVAGREGVERARGLVELDELIDRTNRRVSDQVLKMASTPGTQEWGMRMIVVSRCIERIGDNAVDIGEQTAFLVTGEFHEFTDASH